jgi:hypothetical protein
VVPGRAAYAAAWNHSKEGKGVGKQSVGKKQQMLQKYNT